MESFASSSAPTEAAPAAFELEEGHAFLQQRVAEFFRMGSAVSALFLVSIGAARAFSPAVQAAAGPKVDIRQMLLVAALAFMAAMWLAARGRPLPVTVLRVMEGPGTVAVSWILAFQIPLLPLAFHAEQFALLALMAQLLYRSAVIPSDPTRTTWVGVLSALPLLGLTFVVYTRASGGNAPAWFMTYLAALWCVAAISTARVTSRVIYGLQQTVSEARRLGQYTIVEKIGQGGMGAVYRARHALLRRPTAIKLLLPEQAGEINLKRFEREVQMTALLTSPHTVSVYDFGRTHDGIFYYAMEYLDGIDLESLIAQEGPLPPGRVVHVLGQVCAALHEAHLAGLIHRDIKPANIILCVRGGTHDFAKVVDFGLVKDVQPNRSLALTAENVISGTPYYMAPEAIRADSAVDAQSDVYALGATAYFLLTGRPVFEGSPIEVFGHHLGTRPETPSARLGRPIPTLLEAAVLEALEKSPDRRPIGALAFAQRLAACDDVPPWTAASAAAWWRERGPALRRPGTKPSTGHHTVNVDLSAPR